MGGGLSSTSPSTIYGFLRPITSSSGSFPRGWLTLPHRHIPNGSFPGPSASRWRHAHDSLSLADTKGKTGEMLISPRGQVTGYSSWKTRRRQEGHRGPEAPSLLNLGRATVQGDYFSALPARFPDGGSGQEAGPPTGSSKEFRLLEFSTHTDRGTSSRRRGWNGSVPGHRLQ